VERRAIHVLASCQKFPPVADIQRATREPSLSDYYEYMWHVKLATHMKAASDEYVYECWSIDPTVDKQIRREVSGISMRLFPCKELSYIGESSRALLHDLKIEARKQNTIVHFHKLFSYLTLLGPLLIRNTPMIVQDHGTESLLQQNHFVHKTYKFRAVALYALTGEWLLERTSIPRFDRIFVLNRQAEKYVTRFASAERVERLTMGIDFDFFVQTNKDHAREMLRLEPDTPYILYLGSLSRHKGADYLLRALPAIIKEYPKSTLLLLGTGPFRQQLVKLARELEICSNVVFILSDEAGQRVAAELLPLYYNAADVFVVPSLAEGLSIAAVEALACGTPLVASNVGGLPEVAATFKAGTLVPPRSPEALAGAIIDVLSGEQSFTIDRENAKRVFDWTHIAERNLEAYNDLFDQYYG
jgi:glycosyltransferase involved in cell wall biosynthesis